MGGIRINTTSSFCPPFGGEIVVFEAIRIWQGLLRVCAPWRKKHHHQEKKKEAVFSFNFL